MPIDEPIDLDQVAPRPESNIPFPALTRSLSLRGTGSPQALALRERSLSDREHIAERNFALRSQQHELAKVHQLSEIAKEEMRVHAAMEKQRQTQRAVSLLSKTGYDDPDYEGKVAWLHSHYPMAMKDETIQKHIQHHYETLRLKESGDAALSNHVAKGIATTEELRAREEALRDPRTATALATEQARQKARNDAALDRIPEGAVSGHAKALGEIGEHTQTLTGIEERRANLPKDLLPQDRAAALANFETEKAVAAAKLEGAKAVQAAFEIAHPGIGKHRATPGAPVIPQDPDLAQKVEMIPPGALDHLFQNPHLAPQFDEMFGAGASSAVIGQ